MTAAENSKVFMLEIGAAPKGIREFQANATDNVAIVDTTSLTVTEMTIQYVNVVDKTIYDNVTDPTTNTFEYNQPVNAFPADEYNAQDPTELTPLCFGAGDDVLAYMAITFDPNIGPIWMTTTVNISNDSDDTFTYSVDRYVTSGESFLVDLAPDVPEIIRYAKYNLSVSMMDHQLPVPDGVSISKADGRYYVVGQFAGAGSVLTQKRVGMLTAVCNNLPCRLAHLEDNRNMILRLWDNRIATHISAVTHLGELNGGAIDSNEIWSIQDGANANAEDHIRCFRHMYECLGVAQSGLNGADKAVYFTLNNTPVLGGWIDPADERWVPSACPSEHSAYRSYEWWGFQARNELWHENYYACIPVLEWLGDGLGDPLYLVPQSTGWKTNIQDVASTIAGWPYNLHTTWVYQADDTAVGYLWNQCITP